jgi:hypothetical protein
MGQSADAILCFGVIVGDPEDKAFPWPPPEYGTPEYEAAKEMDCYDLEELVAKERGVVNPYGKDDYTEADVAKWRADMDAVNASIPVEIVHHGCDGYDSQVLALKGTIVQVSEYGAKQITIPKGPDGCEIQTAAIWCRDHGVHPFTNPGWVLAARLW